MTPPQLHLPPPSYEEGSTFGLANLPVGATQKGRYIALPSDDASAVDICDSATHGDEFPIIKRDGRTVLVDGDLPWANDVDALRG